MVKRRSILALYLPGQPATRHTAPMIANGMAPTELSSKSDLKRPRTDPTLAFLLCLHLRAQRLSLSPTRSSSPQAAGSQPNEVDLVMKGLLAQPGVTAYLIINADGTCRHRRGRRGWSAYILTERARDLRTCTHRAGVRPAEPPRTYTHPAQHLL